MAGTEHFVELAYGTATGQIRLVILHPQSTGHTPVLFQTHSVHTAPVCSVMLSEKHLISGLEPRGGGVRW